MSSLFEPMVKHVPAGKQGVATVEHFKVSKSDSQWTAMRGEYVEPGKYCSLKVHGHLVMSDTAMERNTNWKFVDEAHGNVLIAGLGIGMIITAILKKPEVGMITVVEKYQDVIDLVGPHFPSVNYVCADILTWRPPRSMRWNVIYFDIWSDICTDNLDEIYMLERQFRPHLQKDDPKKWIGSWQKANLQSRKRREG